MKGTWGGVNRRLPKTLKLQALGRGISSRARAPSEASDSGLACAKAEILQVSAVGFGASRIWGLGAHKQKVGLWERVLRGVVPSVMLWNLNFLRV